MKRVAIVFPDAHLAYSPTVLGLQQALGAVVPTEIIAFRNRQFPDVDKPFVTYLPIPFIFRKIYGGVNRFSRSAGRRVHCFLMKGAVRKYIRRAHFDELICVDPVAVWMVQGCAKARVHLLSLELTANTENYIGKIRLESIHSIIIQSPQRLQHLAAGFRGQVFYLQNAPAFNKEALNKEQCPAGNLLFAGTASARFGLFQALDFLRAYPGYSLFLQGKIPQPEKEKIMNEYADLVQSEKLILGGKYLEQAELLKLAARFRIGFCFYDLSYPEINNINYLTAPSGKMFLYFAAGVPVVGINVPGLQPVVDFNAGALIDDMNPVSIKAAIESIESRYPEMVEGCFHAAAHFSFDQAIAPVVQFINRIP
jgi:glycosyltransferase involved in cell wall biosynthesis